MTKREQRVAYSFKSDQEADPEKVRAWLDSLPDATPLRWEQLFDHTTGELYYPHEPNRA